MLPRLILVGAPNSGKTTLYNWLTLSHSKTVNYPGSTVDLQEGILAKRWFEALGKESFDVQVIDTPGTYSLTPKSEDERVTRDCLVKSESSFSVILVMDGTLLSSHLRLAYEMKMSGVPFVLAITMSDLLKKQGPKLNMEALEQEFNCPAVLIDGRLGGGIEELLVKAQALRPCTKITEPQALSDQQILDLQIKSEKLATQFYQVSSEKNKEELLQRIYHRTDQLDRVFLHPLFGLVFFFCLMSLVFGSIYWFATPFMDGIESGFAMLTESSEVWVGKGLIGDFLRDGIIAGFASVFVFVPQIFILFLVIGFLESSGYLTRAASLVDRPFSKLGMSGRSFVPMLSGFACAIPALMATRNISSARDRWITQFVIPLLTCSARLPVYALLIGFVVGSEDPWSGGLWLAGLYLFALLTAAVAAGILQKILKQNGQSLMMMELPLYRLPKFRVLLKQTTDKSLSFIFRAGPVIFVLSVLIWILSTFPDYQLDSAEEKFQNSYLAQAGQAMEPVFEPMGLDWRVGVGVLSSFAAREVFVSTLAVIFKVSAEDEESQSEGLLNLMKKATNKSGELIFTFSSTLGLMVFFSIALQCMSTFAVALKESSSRSLAWIQLIGFNVIAYVLAVGLVQGLRALGIS